MFIPTMTRCASWLNRWRTGAKRLLELRAPRRRQRDRQETFSEEESPHRFAGWLRRHPQQYRGVTRYCTPSRSAQRQYADDGELLGNWPPYRRSRTTGQAACKLWRAVDGTTVRRLDRAIWARVWREQPGEHAAILPYVSPFPNFPDGVWEIGPIRTGTGIRAAVVGLCATTDNQRRPCSPVL